MGFYERIKIESKHGISFTEVEEACLSDRRHIRRGREGLYKVFSPKFPTVLKLMHS